MQWHTLPEIPFSYNSISLFFQMNTWINFCIPKMELFCCKDVGLRTLNPQSSSWNHQHIKCINSNKKVFYDILWSKLYRWVEPTKSKQLNILAANLFRFQEVELMKGVAYAAIKLRNQPFSYKFKLNNTDTCAHCTAFK